MESSTTARASVQVSDTRRRNDSEEKSDVEVVAERLPTKTRSPSRFSRAFVSRSTAPSRTCTDRFSPSATTTSASVAPSFFAMAKTSAASWARCPLVGWIARSGFCWSITNHLVSCCLSSSNRDVIDPNGGQSDADGHRLTLLAAGADAFIEFQIVADHRDLRQNIGTAADQCRALDGPGDLPAFDQIRFTGGEHKLPVGDINLPSPKRDGIQPFVHRTDNLVGIRLSRQHEGIGHTWQDDALVAFAPTVTGHRNSHQMRIQPVRDVAPQDALLDEGRPAGRRAFVIHIQGATPTWQRPIIHDGTDLGGYPFADQVGKRRCLLAVEIRLQAMANGFVQENAGPAAAQHDRHDSRWSVDRRKVEDGDAGSLFRIVQVTVPLAIKLKPDTAAAPKRADLAVAVFFSDASHLQSGQRLDIADQRPFRRSHHHDLILGVKGSHHVFDARIVPACFLVDTVEERHPLGCRHFQL